jgi:hypothetical protein
MEDVEDEGPRDGRAPEQEEIDEDHAVILARRRRLVAAALSSLALGAAVSDCSPTPSVCLSVRPDVEDSGVMAEAQACLSIQRDAAMDEQDASDAAPMPCLDIAPTDGGMD